MDNRRETFVDKVDSQLKGLSEQSLHVFAIILRVAGVALFLESCSDGPFILSLIFLILTMSLADYLDKLRKRRRKTAKMKDYIDVEATPHVEPKPKSRHHPPFTRRIPGPSRNWSAPLPSWNGSSHSWMPSWTISSRTAASPRTSTCLRSMQPGRPAGKTWRKPPMP